MRFAPLAVMLTSLLCAHSVSAKQPPQAAGLQLPPAASLGEFSPAGRSLDGAVLSWYALDEAVPGATPEQQARAFLDRHAAALGLNGVSLRHRITRSGPAGHNVHFSQWLGGVEVHDSRTVVHLSPAGRVTQFSRSQRPAPALRQTQPQIPLALAMSLAGEALQAEAPLRWHAQDLVAYPQAAGSLLAWRLRLQAARPAGDWEVLLDAVSGELLLLWDRAAWLHEDEHAATGTVFDPDPLSSSGTVYGQPITDNGDADYPEIAAEVQLKDLGSLRRERGLYWLSSPWAELVDSEAPNLGFFAQSSSDYLFNREQDGFEAVNVFWHIQHSMTYINETLGIALEPYQYEGGVRFDPHGVDGDDNSHYVPSTGEVAFGEGCVDDAEDADVIWHELGHGIHDWITDGGLSNYIDGLSEGFGDYWAQSYSRSLGQWQPDAEQYQWVFDWDGHNECWGGRITNYALPWPVGITPFPAIHTGGQIFATSLMRIYDRIGRAATDTAVLEGLAMTHVLSTQNDAANAIYQAAEDMGYDSTVLAVMAEEFAASGYLIGVSLPLPLGADDEAGEPAQDNPGRSAPAASAGGSAAWWLLMLPLVLRRRRR